MKEHDIYILTDWSRYHRWEDGRSNYAWDLSALNSNKMTYSNLGQNLTDFASFGLKLHLPLNGKVVSVNRTEKDHDPDVVSAVEFEALNSGSEADLEEKPNNCVEVTPGGPFLFRMLHQKQVKRTFVIFILNCKNYLPLEFYTEQHQSGRYCFKQYLRWTSWQHGNNLHTSLPRSLWLL